MANEHRIKKENDTEVDEIILEAEQASREEKIHLADDAASDGSVKKIGEKVSLILVFVLLLLSIIQSIELFNLRNQIEKGQFAAPASAAPATGDSQGLPSQQGGC